jgi:hypothetical protein
MYCNLLYMKIAMDLTRVYDATSVRYSKPRYIGLCHFIYVANDVIYSDHVTLSTSVTWVL